MTIWREHYFILIFIIIVYTFSIVLNVLLQEFQFQSRTAHTFSHYEYIQFLGSWKLIAADFFWFQFLQKDCARLNAEEIMQSMMVMKKLDPHFTSAFRLAAMSLLTYHNQPLAALDLIDRALTSDVNRADWRLYGYGLMAKSMLTIEEKSKYGFFESDRILAAPRLLALEIPLMPDYLREKLKS
ncbi:MAG TPA: hypothetical protein VHO47_04025 [Candidatus Babeliales bacterium]|nr:hypothetical protein [Candidatus Babeliales bacterium]